MATTTLSSPSARTLLCERIAHALSPEPRRHRGRAREWFRSRDPSGHFAAVCLAAGMDPNRVRVKITGLIDQMEKTGGRSSGKDILAAVDDYRRETNPDVLAA